MNTSGARVGRRPAPTGGRRPVHSCPGRCARTVPVEQFACRRCWYRLPAGVREAIRDSRHDLHRAVEARTAARDWFDAEQPACRAVEVATESHGDVVLHVIGGSSPLSEENRAALGILAEAVIAHVDRTEPHLAVVQELMLATSVACRAIEDEAVKARLRAAAGAARDALTQRAGAGG